MADAARRFLSSGLTGPWKKALSTLCILNASPGARVGQAWLKVRAMNGSSNSSLLSCVTSISFVPPKSVFTMTVWEGGVSRGRGIDTGKLGFDVELVGWSEMFKCSGRIPGAKRTTTFPIACRFLSKVRINFSVLHSALTSTFSHGWGAASPRRCKTRSRISCTIKFKLWIG